MAATACLACVAAMRWRVAAPLDEPLLVPAVSVSRHVPVVAADTIVAAADQAVDNDPFRLSQSAPTVRFDGLSDGQPVSTLPVVAAPRPSLLLKGIVGGPPWLAIIDGLPGQPAGTVAREGSIYDKLLIRTITRDSVVVKAADTSWVLTFRPH